MRQTPNFVIDVRKTIILVTALTVLVGSVSSWAADRVAAAGDAYIDRDDAAHTWTVANASISATFLIDRGRESRLLHLTNVVTGHAWAAASGSDTVTTVGGRKRRLGASDAGYQLVDVIATSTDRSVHLTLAFDHRDTHLRVTRHYVVYAGAPAIEAWTRFETQAGGDYEVSDLNFWINCDRPGHGHGASDGNFAHVMGLYEVLATLRERYPELVIENVAGGGNRMDYGMLRYTDVAWMDDRTAPSLHVRHNFEGLGTAFPPSYLLSFLIDHDTESLYDGPDLPLYIRSRMLGVLGLTFRTADLRPSAAGDITGHISLYKELRDTIKEGSAILLTRQASIDDPPEWSAVQETDAAGHTLIFAFQNDPEVEHTILKPRSLTPDAMYDVRSVDVGPIGSASGADLMENGIEVIKTPKSAAHLLVITEQPK